MSLQSRLRYALPWPPFMQAGMQAIAPRLRGPASNRQAEPDAWAADCVLTPGPRSEQQAAIDSRPPTRCSVVPVAASTAFAGGAPSDSSHCPLPRRPCTRLRHARL